jgi:hypothetical protein
MTPFAVAVISGVAAIYWNQAMEQYCRRNYLPLWKKRWSFRWGRAREAGKQFDSLHHPVLIKLKSRFEKSVSICGYAVIAEGILLIVVIAVLELLSYLKNT